MKAEVSIMRYNNYQCDSRVLHIFITNKLFDQLLDISTKNSIFLKTFNLEFFIY